MVKVLPLGKEILNKVFPCSNINSSHGSEARSTGRCLLYHALCINSNLWQCKFGKHGLVAGLLTNILNYSRTPLHTI